MVKWSVLPARYDDDDIYIYIFGEMVDFGKSDKMIKIHGKVDKSNIYNGFNGNISFCINRRTSSLVGGYLKKKRRKKQRHLLAHFRNLHTYMLIDR